MVNNLGNPAVAGGMQNNVYSTVMIRMVTCDLEAVLRHDSNDSHNEQVDQTCRYHHPA